MKFWCFLIVLATSPVFADSSYTLQTVKYDVLAPKGGGDVRLFWEGEISNNTVKPALVSPSVVLLDQGDQVLMEFSLADVQVDRLSKTTAKQVFTVRQDLWSKTVSVGGRISLSGAAREKKIEFYVMPDCRQCTEAREFLKRHGVEFEEYDVRSDEKARRRLMQKHNVNILPTLVIDTKVLVNFNQYQWAPALGITVDEEDEY